MHAVYENRPRQVIAACYFIGGPADCSLKEKLKPGNVPVLLRGSTGTHANVLL